MWPLSRIASQTKFAESGGQCLVSCKLDFTAMIHVRNHRTCRPEGIGASRTVVLDKREISC